MNIREEVTLSRSAEAVMIPSGEKVLVPEGARATITQSLGGSFTLITERGLMVRISGRDVEAIGKTPQVVPGADAPGEEIAPAKLEEMVWDQLKTCYDPEIPVNIVDLGLVYLCELEDSEGAKNVKIKMTLTAPGCGMGPVLASDVKSKVEALPGVKQADVEVVFDPMWDRSMMSEAAKLQLGMY
jgi:probable FeS assembly SUF system protein SufT